MSRETNIEITLYHFPSKYCIARDPPAGSIYTREYYSVDRDDWGQEGSLWSYLSHAEKVFKQLHAAIRKTGRAQLT